MDAARRLAAFLAAGTVALASGGAARAADGPATLVVPLRPIANAAVSGTATFVDLGNGRSQAIVIASGAAAADAGPVDLRDGSCPVPGGVRHPLAPFADGTSLSEVPLSVADLKAGHLAVVLHRVPPPPVTDATGFLACGDVTPPAPATPRTGDSMRTMAVGGAVGTVALVAATVALVAARQRRRHAGVRHRRVADLERPQGTG